jgi:ankyrin repeat protein
VEIEKILELDNVHLLESLIQGNKHHLKYVDEDGNNLLLKSLELSLSDEVVALLIKHIDFREANESGITPFFEAIRKNREKWVIYMIENGVDVNHTDRDSGFTPLMEAVTSNSEKLTKLLLKNGADLELRDSHGYSAYDFARKMRRVNLVQILEGN